MRGGADCTGTQMEISYEMVKIELSDKNVCLANLSELSCFTSSLRARKTDGR